MQIKLNEKEIEKALEFYLNRQVFNLSNQYTVICCEGSDTEMVVDVEPCEAPEADGTGE